MAEIGTEFIIKPDPWMVNACFVFEYGGFVNWENRCYECPSCHELIFDNDWTDEELKKFICPMCEDREENKND